MSYNQSQMCHFKIGKCWIFLLIFSIFSISSWAQNVVCNTYQYAVKGSDTLMLDVYKSHNAKVLDTPKPCIIYIFGGGFVMGSRKDSFAQEPLHKLAQKGYMVVAIDYRLGFKKKYDEIQNGTYVASKNKLKEAKTFLNNMFETINMATEDLYDATSYLIAHHNELSINPNQIILLGSSAGAVTALHGIYHIANEDTIATQHLPTNFNYAGVISMAGAIYSMNGDPKWKKAPCPILFFHGDADKNVPYFNLSAKVLFINLKYRFSGSEFLTEQLDKLKSPYTFYSYTNRAHEMSYLPMENSLDTMDYFIKESVINKKQITYRIITNDLSLPEKKKNLGVKDFFAGNGMK